MSGVVRVALLRADVAAGAQREIRVEHGEAGKLPSRPRLYADHDAPHSGSRPRSRHYAEKWVHVDL